MTNISIPTAVLITFPVDMPKTAVNKAARKIARDTAIQEVTRAVNTWMYGG